MQVSAVSQYGDLSPNVRATKSYFHIPYVARRKSLHHSETYDPRKAYIVKKGRAPCVPFVDGMRYAL